MGVRSDMRWITVLAASAFVGCFDSSTDGVAESGIGKQYYVAVGNSLTAGYQSGGIRADWQQLSYPALIARQMGVDADFQIPSVDTPGIGSKQGGVTIQPLELDPSGRAIAAPKPLTVSPAALLSNKALPRPYNNLAVPGCTTRDFIFASDSATSQSRNNGLFDIVLRPGLMGGLSMMRQAILLQPTILTMGIGSNDILGGITSGDVREGVTVTPVAYYSQLMDLALDTLLRETEAHIFLSNIPSITSIPFVTTVPTWIPDSTFTRPLSDTSFKFSTAESDVRFVLLPALSQIQKGHGVPKPYGLGDSLSANLTLTATEAATATKLIDGYNAYLKAKCDADPDHLTLVDLNGLLAKLIQGEIPGLSGKFPLFDPAHSAFSLDGVHPNSKGYKEVANLNIDAINSAMKTSYKHVGE
jgi:lysophospholipase L1-like esterase